jgi:hypothetical protein
MACPAANGPRHLLPSPREPPERLRRDDPQLRTRTDPAATLYLIAALSPGVPHVPAFDITPMRPIRAAPSSCQTDG